MPRDPRIAAAVRRAHRHMVVGSSVLRDLGVEIVDGMVMVWGWTDRASHRRIAMQLRSARVRAELLTKSPKSY